MWPVDATDYLQEMTPIVLLVLVSEVFVDWTKHAFITKFNDISPDVYHQYRSILARDLASSQHQQVYLTITRMNARHFWRAKRRTHDACGILKFRKIGIYVEQYSMCDSVG